MPLPLPILERITLDIETWLQRVQPPAFASKFTVERRKKRGNAPKAGQTLVVIHQGNPIPVPVKSQDQTKWDQPYAIEIFTDPDESRETPVDADLNLVIADTQKVLTFEPQSRNRGGLAEDTKLAAPILFVRSSLSGVIVGVVVRYATEFNDPFRSAYSNITY